MKLQGRKIYPGIARGEALVTSQGISFFGGVDPESGVVVERGHELEGHSIAGKILVFPTGKGSTVGSYTLYRLKANRIAPLAILNAECEPITAVGCIIGEIPCIDQIDLQRLKSGQQLLVDGAAGIVEILAPANAPAMLVGSEPDSFAKYTMSSRLPAIARRVAQQECWSPQAHSRLEALADEMPHGRIRPIQDNDAPDFDLWQGWTKPYLGQTWLEAPWFPAETYFFRRILEASGYFQNGPDQGIDPYQVEKSEGMELVISQIEAVWSGLQQAADGDESDLLKKLLHAVIWGNQADLSIWPAGGASPTAMFWMDNHSGEEVRLAHLLADHAGAIADTITCSPHPLERVDFILDNVGLELASDLLLADFLLSNQWVHSIRFYAKPFPTYVSDATIPDVLSLVASLARADAPGVQLLGQRLRSYLEEQRLQLHTHLYWISPLAGWEIPEDLRAELGETSLIISKGDANYRRWLGDRHWSFAAPIDEILAYHPAPLLLLRVLKSEIIAGLRPGQADEMFSKDPKWMFDGNWGVIQFIP